MSVCVCGWVDGWVGVKERERECVCVFIDRNVRVDEDSNSNSLPWLITISVVPNIVTLDRFDYASAA